MLQNVAEHAIFSALLQSEGVRSYLEIGAKAGGSIRLVAQALPTSSRIVGVDMPQQLAEDREELLSVFNVMGRLGFDARLILGDSQHPDTVARVAALGPFDAVFIDADHSMSGVTHDWENYGPMGRIVAFHDIGHRRTNWPAKIRVPEFWEAIKGNYRHQEIVLEAKDNGIGVLWR